MMPGAATRSDRQCRGPLSAKVRLAGPLVLRSAAALGENPAILPIYGVRFSCGKSIGYSKKRLPRNLPLGTSSRGAEDVREHTFCRVQDSGLGGWTRYRWIRRAARVGADHTPQRLLRSDARALSRHQCAVRGGLESEDG